MARFRPIFTAIWDDDDEFLRYSDSGKTLFLYLVTNSNCTESGVYKISLRNISNTLGWKSEKFANVLKELKGNPTTLQGNVFYDDSSKIVFIKNFYKYNGMKIGRPDLVEKSIVKDATNFPSPLWHLFIRTYPKFGQSLAKVLEYFGQSISESNSDSDSDCNSSLSLGGVNIPPQPEPPIKKTFTPPTEAEFVKYFFDNGYDREYALQAYKGYAVADWHDSRGAKIKSWKQKAVHVWFKPEKKTGQKQPVLFDVSAYRKKIGFNDER